MGINKIAYKNIRVEMAAQKLTIKQIAFRMKIPVDTVSRKLCGFASFKLEEAMKLRDLCFPGKPLEYLFEEIAQRD